MNTSDEEVDALAENVRRFSGIYGKKAADMLLALKAERATLRNTTYVTLESRAEAAEKRAEKIEAAYNREVSLRNSEQRDDDEPADNPYDHGRALYATIAALEAKP